MTNPIDTSPEAIAALLDGVTPGPWPMQTMKTSCGVCHKIGPWPHKWRGGKEMSACIYDDYPSPAEGTDTMIANARFIAASRELVPALAAERDAAKAEVARRVEMHECAMQERDDAILHWGETNEKFEKASAEIARLTAERDEARAQVAELQDKLRFYEHFTRHPDAALAARDAAMRNEGRRQAATICNMSYGDGLGAAHASILAALEPEGVE